MLNINRSYIMVGECRNCGSELPPRINRCLNCGESTRNVEVPTNPFWWDEAQIDELVESAQHPSVTYDNLANNDNGITYADLALRPLIGYMWEEEFPLFVLHSSSNPVTIIDNSTERGWEIEFGSARHSSFLVSDRRFLFASGTTKICHDILISIPYEDIRSVSVANKKERPSGAQAFVVKTVDTEYILPVSDESEELLMSIAESASEQSEPTNVSTEQNKLLAVAAIGAASGSITKVDQILSESNSSKEAINAIVATFETDWRKKVTDHDIKNSDSLAELLSKQDALPEQAGMKAGVSRKEKLMTTTAAGGAGVASAGLITTVQSTLENADIAQAAFSGIETSQAALPMAVAAPWSTPLVLGAIASAGIATEIYKSGNDETIIDDIDPSEVVRRAQSGSKAGKKYDLGDVDGAKVGATVSAARYLAENITHDEYLQLVMESNPELMMEGAELGVKLSGKGQIPLGDRTGVVSGMAVGLKESYTEGQTELTEEDLKRVLDEDLFYQYLSKVNAEEGR